MAAIAHNEYRLIGPQKNSSPLRSVLACFFSPDRRRGRGRKNERPFIAATCKFEGGQKRPIQAGQFGQHHGTTPSLRLSSATTHATSRADSDAVSVAGRPALKLKRFPHSPLARPEARCLRGMSRQHLPLSARGGGAVKREQRGGRAKPTGEGAFLHG